MCCVAQHGSAHISSFSPALVKQAEGDAEDGDVPAKTSTRDEEKSAEDGKGGETESGSGPSAAQQASALVNQEAWSRLRDGKGVEPEDLEKSHQLTPPAYVRPKREADDDQPLEVELAKKEQVTSRASSIGLINMPVSA